MELYLCWFNAFLFLYNQPAPLFALQKAFPQPSVTWASTCFIDRLACGNVNKLPGGGRSSERNGKSFKWTENPLCLYRHLIFSAQTVNLDMEPPEQVREKRWVLTRVLYRTATAGWGTRFPSGGRGSSVWWCWTTRWPWVGNPLPTLEEKRTQGERSCLKKMHQCYEERP